MKVTVRLLASLRIKWGEEIVRDCPRGTRIEEIVAAIGMPTDERYIILLNGTHASVSDPLEEGDVLTLLPLIGGG